jgi:hypothetical protein
MCFTLFPPQAAAQVAPARVTIIYDGFGKPSNLARGWGYSALIEYGGKRILFDTGGRYRAFAENVGKLGINLKSLDLVVISHRMATILLAWPTCCSRTRTSKFMRPSKPDHLALR